ncbi:unnamed protein product [Moneuplotes crassus]|uniref:Uncharacterized protein n=1 Tax=Euplotes crassus TaxID=5936 RepID=A0AAD1XBF7_EUPCR|nr:unnamed protein product [Moneuplotes crassus]
MSNYDSFTSVEFSKEKEKEDLDVLNVKKISKSTNSCDDTDENFKTTKKMSFARILKKVLCCSGNQYSKNSVGSKRRKYLPDHLKEHIILNVGNRPSRRSKRYSGSTVKNGIRNDMLILPPCLELLEMDPKEKPKKCNPQQLELLENTQLGSYERVLNKSRSAMSLNRRKTVGVFLSRFRERKSNCNTSDNTFGQILDPDSAKGEDILSEGCSPDKA